MCGLLTHPFRQGVNFPALASLEAVYRALQRHEACSPEFIGIRMKQRFGHFQTRQDRRFDRGILYGALLAAIVLALSILGSPSLKSFIDLKSLALVVGGTIASALINFSIHDLAFTVRRVREVSKSNLESPRARIAYFVRLSQLVRTQGVMALEREARRLGEPLTRRALELAADGGKEKDLLRILETERLALADNERRAIEVLETLGNYAPAFGLIGTLLGLVEMLSVLDNAAAVGPAMALALLTTLYGAILANLVFLPLAGKVRLRNEEENLLRSLTIEGTLSLSNVENPILLEQRLLTFLPGFSESRLAA